MPERKDSFFPWLFKFVLPPILVISIAAFGMNQALKMRPRAEKTSPVEILPVVEVVEVHAEPLTLQARSQGTVQSRTETLLIAEVSGRIQSVSEAFLVGGYFKKGDPLIEIDPIDYRANLATAKSRYAEARLAYEQEKALSEQALEDWKEMGQGQGSDLTLRKPQLERAKALLDATQSGIEIAERDLSRTTIRAPYDGRIREKFVDLGQMVAARQSQLARIYSIDAAEIRLPIALKDMQYLELPETYSNRSASKSKPKVLIHARYGDEIHAWEGIIDRMEGAIDPRTRLSYAIAKIDAPYEQGMDSNRPPLKVGLFVEATIEGKRIPDAIRIPRQALRENDMAYVVDQENRLQFKPVTVYKTDENWAIITDGLKDGDRICTTSLEYAVMGMNVALESEKKVDLE